MKSLLGLLINAVEHSSRLTVFTAAHDSKVKIRELNRSFQMNLGFGRSDSRKELIQEDLNRLFSLAWTEKNHYLLFTNPWFGRVVVKD